MTNTAVEKRERLNSLDTLRGFDMLWIIGGDELISVLAKVTGWNWMDPIARQMHHVRNFSLVRLQVFWAILAKF
jgi:hypothetical protein